MTNANVKKSPRITAEKKIVQFVENCPSGEVLCLATKRNGNIYLTLRDANGNVLNTTLLQNVAKRYPKRGKVKK